MISDIHPIRPPDKNREKGITYKIIYVHYRGKLDSTTVLCIPMDTGVLASVKVLSHMQGTQIRLHIAVISSSVVYLKLQICRFRQNIVFLHTFINLFNLFLKKWLEHTSLTSFLGTDVITRPETYKR